MTNDGFHAYKYDAEGNIVSVDSGSTASYSYDALNHRGRSIVGSTVHEFVYNAAGQRASIWNGNTKTVIQGQYYWGTKHVAYYLAGGAVNFQHQDWTGSEQIRTNSAGIAEETDIYLPFGDGFTAEYSDTDPYHYSMLDHDYETDTEHAQFRQYSSAQGRFLSPDPYGGSYDPSNPQSFNRYAYALNNPLSNIDPSGLILCDYGSSDNGGEDFEDADNSAECFSNGGTLANDSVSVSVNGNNPSDPGITTENGEQIYPTISPNGPGGTPTKVPCTQTTGYKVTQGVLGTANLTLAGIKTVGLVATDGLLGIATPFTGGASAAVAAAGTVYGVTSIGGQAIAGTGQLYTALGGNAQTGEQISQVGDILSGPISGLTTLIGSGGNLAQAQQNANLESTITAGAGLVNSKGFGEAVDFGLSLFGLSGAGCKP